MLMRKLAPHLAPIWYDYYITNKDCYTKVMISMCQQIDCTFNTIY